MSLLGTLATGVLNATPFGTTNAIVNKVSGGSIGYDPTPGYSLTAPISHALTNTQINNHAGGSVPNANTGVDANGAGTVLGANTTANQTPTYTQGVNDPATLARNQQAIGIANSALGRLPGELQTAQGQVQHTYDQNQNELQSGYNAANQNYGQSTAQNGQQFVTNKNQINSQASQGLRGLLTILGQHGAGGSSAAQYAAPNAVGQVSAQQRAGAGQTFGQNQQSLDTNWGNYQTGFDNSKKQLSDWLNQNLNQAQATSEGSRQSLLQTIAGLQGTPAQAQPYIDQINQSAANVDELAKFNPSYNGVTPTYTAPDVASYTVKQNGAPTVGTPGNNTSASPALAFLLGLNKDKNQLQPSF